MKNGAYIDQPHAKIVATVATLKHFRAFLASNCDWMIDPYSSWTRDEINKAQAQTKLTWLVNVAINRKAGVPDAQRDWELWRLSRAVNTPRLIVRDRECPKRYQSRLVHRLTHPDDECY